MLSALPFANQFVEVDFLVAEIQILNSRPEIANFTTPEGLSAGFCCQVPANPALGCKAQGLKFQQTRTAYAARAIAGARLSFATVRFEPITVVSNRNKANPFRRSSILFRPQNPQMKDVWWSRRVPPPGPIRVLQARLCL